MANNLYTKSEYQAYVDKKSKNSPIGKDMLLAFLIGGAVCVIGQLAINFFTERGIPKEIASSMGSMVLIVITAILTAVGWFDNIAKYAGAGTAVPITGFANSIISPSMDSKQEGMVMGVGAKMFTIAGPVILYGVSTSIILGFIYFFLNSQGG